MNLGQFLHELFEHGHVRFRDSHWEEGGDDLHEIGGILAERERVVAAEFPAPVPPIDLHAAAWAARQFYRLAHFVMHRGLAIEEVRQSLAEPCPAGEAAAQHYSVDLTLRFLPDLDRLAGTLAPRDPLRELIRERGAVWPYSSIGIKGCVPSRTAELLAHPGLRRAYIDRIIERRDASRLADEQVCALVLAALGRERQAAATWCNAAALAVVAAQA